MIPNNIFQTYNIDELPEYLKKNQIKLKAINNNFNYFFYNNQECINFIKENYNKYYKIYNTFPHYLQKENLFKLLIIYHYGGFYFDIDFICEKNIEVLQKYSCVLPEEKEITKENFYKKYGKRNKNETELKQIGIYGFGAEKGHPLILDIVEEMYNRFNDYKKIELTLDNTNILVIEKTSGSDIVSIIYHSYKELYSNIKILKGNDCSVLDKDRICPKNWYKFGNFGEYIYTKSSKRIQEYLDVDSLKIDIYEDDYHYKKELNDKTEVCEIQ